MADFQNVYTYDSFSRVTRVEQTGTAGGNPVTDKRVDFGYDPFGQFTRIDRYADLAGAQLAVSSTYSYDLQGRLNGITHAKGAATLASYSYTYDSLSRIAQMTSTDGTSTYTYDAVSQLTGAAHTFHTDETYSYDLNGNRTNTGYVTGPNNQLLSDETFDFAYDREGNLVRRTDRQTGEVDEFEWDYRNRLTRVASMDASGNVILEVEFVYDANDRRIAKSVDADGAGPAAAEDEYFIYDGDEIVLTLDAAGNVQHRYLHGPAVDQALVDEFFSDPNAVADVLYSLGDHQGSVRDVAQYDAAADQTTVVNHIQYDSYGQVIGETNPLIEVRFRFTGREFDRETGLYYYRARYYDARTGRFLGEDRLGFEAGDTNLFRYVINDPVNNTDPSGEIIIGLLMATFLQGDMRTTKDKQDIGKGVLLVGGILGLAAAYATKLLTALGTEAITIPATEEVVKKLIVTIAAEAAMEEAARTALREVLTRVAKDIATKVDELWKNPCKLAPTGFPFTLHKDHINKDGGEDKIPLARWVRISKAQIKKGSDPNSEAKAFRNRYGYRPVGDNGQTGDNAGHLQAKELGGPGSAKKVNIMPQEWDANQNKQKPIEDGIRRRIEKPPHHHECILVVPLYSGLDETRPHYVVYVHGSASAKNFLASARFNFIQNPVPLVHGGAPTG